MKKKIVLKMFGLVCLFSILIGSSSFAATRYGTAKVWAGIPLIGHVYVCTPYTVNYSMSPVNIKSITTQRSYTSAGVALVSYTHYSTWARKTGARTFSVNATGHCDFVFKGCPISMGLQTFRDDIRL